MSDGAGWPRSVRRPSDLTRAELESVAERAQYAFFLRLVGPDDWVLDPAKRWDAGDCADIRDALEQVGMAPAARELVEEGRT